MAAYTRGMGIWLVVFAFAGSLAAWATDVETAFREGRAALEREDAEAAIRSLEAARAQALDRADVSFYLALAYAVNGQPADAIAYFAEAARLDPDGIGVRARADEAKLRRTWLRVELEAGREALSVGAYAMARDTFEKAFTAAGDAQPEKQREAQIGYVRASVGELVASALKDRSGADSAALVPLGPARRGGAAGELLEAVEAELVTALKARDIQVVPARQSASADLVVRGTVGQQLRLQIEDRSSGGAIAARVVLRLLVDEPIEIERPDPIELRVSIDAERDVPGGAPVPIPRVAEGTVLQSGDRFRIHVHADREVYLYVFFFDSQGRATLLYPGTERLFPDLAASGVVTTNPTPGGRQLQIPPAPSSPKEAEHPWWFTLDEHPGTESFYVAASIEPLRDIEALVRELDATADVPGASRGLAERLKKRGRTTQIGVEHDDAVSEHLEILRGRGTVVRYLAFQHR